MWGWVVGQQLISAYGRAWCMATRPSRGGGVFRRPSPWARLMPGTLLARLSSEHNVAQAFFTGPHRDRAPSNAKTPRAEEIGKYDFCACRALIWQGNWLTPIRVDLGARKAGKPVYEHWWQTETGLHHRRQPQRGSRRYRSRSDPPTVADCRAMDVQILNEGRRTKPAGTLGSIAIKLPLPPARCRPCGMRGPVSQKLTSHVSG